MKAETERFAKKVAMVSLLAFALRAPAAMGANGAKAVKGRSEDIVAHVSTKTNDAVLLAERSSGGKQYLFLDQPSLRTVTVIDISNAKKPRVVKSVAYPDGAQSAGEIFGTNLILVRGDKSNRGDSTPAEVIAFGGPDGPDASEEFSGVTSFLADNGRGLVYFTNGDGLWIVRSKRPPEQDMDLMGIYG